MIRVALRPSRPADIAFITALERDPANRELIGQWSDAEHLAAIAGENGREHWMIETDRRPAGYLIAYDCRAKGAGFHVKRLLVAEKDRGIGREALRQFDAYAFAQPGTSCVWLNVRDSNARAQRVYEGLGFVRFDPPADEAARYDAAAEPPSAGAFRMRLPQP